MIRKRTRATTRAAVRAIVRETLATYSARVPGATLVAPVGRPAGEPIRGPKSALLHPAIDAIRTSDREVLVAVGLNSRNVPVASWVVGMGNLNACLAGPREVFGPALAGPIAGVIIAHNHPSGDPNPSPEDITVAKRCKEAGAVLGIDLLDALIVTASGYVSLAERNLFSVK